MVCEERLDVVAINTLSPLRAEDTANGLQAAEGAKTHQPYWRMAWWTLRWFPPPAACGIAQEPAQPGLHQGTSIIHPSSRCASVGVQATPLIGTISCGQAEKATTQSSSARSKT